MKANALRQAIAEELQQRVVAHEEQRSLWDAAMEDSHGVQEALKKKLSENEERSSVKLELVRAGEQSST